VPKSVIRRMRNRNLMAY